MLQQDFRAQDDQHQAREKLAAPTRQMPPSLAAKGKTRAPV
jgi:hypothetical protein